VSSTEVRPARPRLERGVCVGRYVVLRWLAEGGMGVVYKAYDPELERAVALKLLQSPVDAPAASEEANRDRLFREAKALARLSHPNVVAIYDFGTFGDDAFLATEYVEGPTLSTWLEQKRRPRAEVLAVLLDAGEGLAAAHRAGLVHRDFKPSNVIVSTDGRARVLDFGLARAEANDRPPTSRRGLEPGELGSEPALPVAATTTRSKEDVTLPSAGTVVSPSLLPPSSNPPRPSSSPPSLRSASTGLLDKTITGHGQVVGTPMYMAPEQHLGHVSDARSDQYSFCVALYQALYGELPFDGRGDVYKLNVLQGRLRGAPPGSDVPRWMRQLVVRGLSVSPTDRFPSLDDLLAGLRDDPAAKRLRWLGMLAAGAATLALAGGLALRPARPAAEPPCRGAARKLAGVWDDDRKQALHSAFAATGWVGAEDAYGRAASVLDDYARAWVAMHTDACEATQVRGEQSAEMLDLRMQCLGADLEDLRAQVDVLLRADRETASRSVQAVHALPRLGACADTLALRAPIPPPHDDTTEARATQVRMRLARARAEQRAGHYGSALDAASQASEEATQLGYRPVEAEALYVLGDVQDDEGDYSASEGTFRRSFAAALAGRHEAQAARTLSALVVEAGLRQGHFAEAHEWARLADAAIERSNDAFIKGELARNEARLFLGEEKLADAHAAIDRCLALWEPALGDDFAVAGAVTDLGNVLLYEGDVEAARAAYTRSLAISEKAVGPDSPLLAPNLNNLGEIAVERGETDEAERVLERARTLWQSSLGPDHPKVALVLYNLSAARLQRGDAEGALKLAQQALDIWRKALPAEHTDVAQGLHGVAVALRAKKDFAGALAREGEALAMAERLLGPDAEQVAQSLTSIGETRLAQGQPGTTAVAPLTRALGILEATGASGPELGDLRFDLARALAKTDPARSRQLAAQARESYASASSPLATRKTAEIDAWLVDGKATPGQAPRDVPVP
jgi:serine/threonine protein kinase/tetratricopeptide (TPR) repeat protein